jgi:signal transduction histidine kinase
LRASWRAFWSPGWYRDRSVLPVWLEVVWRFLFNTAIAVGITVLAWAFAGRLSAWPAALDAFKSNFVIAQCIGFTIAGMFAAGARLLGPERLDRFTWPQRVIFFAGIPIIGVLIGYAIGLTLLGTDVPRLVVERPNILAAILLLSLLLSAFWYRFMANKERLIGAEAERERERARAAVLERQALDAQLRALQAQIEPHFLFNTLANVVGLIDAQPGDAKRMLERLIELLRGSLSASRASHATLGQELDLCRAYLDILAIRMGRRLRYDISAPDELRVLPLPPMLLQPLVENAIRHGLEPKLDGGAVRLKVGRTDNGRLELSVQDDGVGFGELTRGGGVGLSNLRERLATHFGRNAALAIEDALPGTRVRLTVPLPPSD